MTLRPTTRQSPAKTPAGAATFPVADPKAVKKRILVVDDDPQIRESLGKVLRAEEYEVVLAATGREAIEKSNTERVDLILLDVILPDISGWDVFGAVTSLNPFLPIIVVTGKNDQDQLALLSGVGALIEKPLRVPSLLETITKMLAESPETRLKRLLGHHQGLRHVPSAPRPRPALSGGKKGGA